MGEGNAFKGVCLFTGGVPLEGALPLKGVGGLPLEGVGGLP